MSWLKLDDAFPDHPKIEALSDGAFRLHVSGLIHCAKHLTDGYVPTARVPKLMGYSKRALAQLVAAGLWHPRSDGYDLHDYLDWNRSRKQVEMDRHAAAERQRKRRESQGSHAVTDAVSHTTRSRPDQTEVYSASLVDEDLVFPPGTVRGRLPVPAPPPVEVDSPKTESRCATRTLRYGRSAPYLTGLDLALIGDVTRPGFPAALAHQEAPHGPAVEYRTIGDTPAPGRCSDVGSGRPHLGRLRPGWHDGNRVVGWSDDYQRGDRRCAHGQDRQVLPGAAVVTAHEVDYIPAAGLFVASCSCGWESEPSRSLASAVVAFTGHRRSSDLMERPVPMDAGDA